MGCGSSRAEVELHHVNAKPSEQRVRVFVFVDRCYCCFGLVPWSVHVRHEGTAEDVYGPDAMAKATNGKTTRLGL